MRRLEARGCAVAATALLIGALSGCSSWQGPNSLPLPGTAGGGKGSYEVKIEMPNVSSLERNSRVRVADVDAGNVEAITLDGWHALVTVRLDGSVVLPANASAKIGQTSLLGTSHIELAPPVGIPATGRLKPGATIPMSRASLYPTTEQTLAVVSTVLNGGGLGQLQEVNTELNKALGGHETEVRSLLGRIDTFIGALNVQKKDIISAMHGLDRLAGTVDGQRVVLDNALTSIPRALEVLASQRDALAGAVIEIGNFSEIAGRALTASKDELQQNLRNIRPVLQGLADAGPDLTRALKFIPTFPWPSDNIKKFVRGDAANLSGTFDLTLGRLDNDLLVGTPLDGSLIAVETALGRTVGRQPYHKTTRNPLTAGLENVVQRGVSE